ncbi:MAG: SGNH/GDSL hydrolase family protein, partial [Deltaproteobacteria bacterium]|nr:SGNH/GDSL hydrolase family protein [Deltaproteobacteria bacterium]
METRSRRILASAVLIVLGIGLGFVIAEMAIRLLGLSKPEFYAYSPTRGWKLRAGASGWQTEEGCAFVRVNRWGYRGPDWSRFKPNGTLRVAVVGDSFIEAQQVSEHETICSAIQRDLTSVLPLTGRSGHQRLNRVEVMNFGVDGYGTAQEFFTVTEDVWKFSPDVVVLAFFPGNDVRNNSVAMEGDKCRPFFVPQPAAIVLGGPFEDSRLFHFQCFMRFESYRSQLLDMLGQARSALRSIQRKRRTHAGLQPVSYQPVGIVTKEVHEPGINDLIYRPPINQEWREAWKVSEAEIEMTEQNVRLHHALFLLVIVGTGIQVMPDAAFQDGYLRAVGGTDLLYPSHRLTALAAQRRFAVLDLVPLMSSYALDHHLYFHGFPNTAMGTGHWNELGHRFAGSLVASRI